MKDCLHVTPDPETRAALRALNDLNLGALAANAGISMAGFAEGRSMGGLGPIPVNLHALVLHEAGVMAQAMRGEWVEACQELATLGAKVRAAMQSKPAASLHYKLEIDTSAARAAIDDLGDYLKAADAKLNPLGSPADPVSVARALLRHAMTFDDVGALAFIAEARAWVALDR